MIEVTAHYSFGVAGSAGPFMREGWSHPEPGFCWTQGTRSRLSLPRPQAEGQVVIEIHLHPLICAPGLRSQRLIISVNDHKIGDEILTDDCTMALEVPAQAMLGAQLLEVQLNCPTATIPAAIGASEEGRQLGVMVRELVVFRVPFSAPPTPRFRPPLRLADLDTQAAVRGLTGLEIADLATRFQSLGHNCEFGLAQRGMGAEALGLLRFAGIPVRRLLEGIDLDFEGIDAPGNLAISVADAPIGADTMKREYIVRDRRYETYFHTGMYLDGIDQDSILRKFTRHLTFLRARFLENLAKGNRIFVFHHPAAQSAAKARPILNLLRSHGPNVLLYVTDDGEDAPGAVHQLEDDLFQGRVGRFAPVQNAVRFDLPPWISVCANAYRLWRESGRGG